MAHAHDVDGRPFVNERVCFNVDSKADGAFGYSGQLTPDAVRSVAPMAPPKGTARRVPVHGRERQRAAVEILNSDPEMINTIADFDPEGLLRSIDVPFGTPAVDLRRWTPKPGSQCPRRSVTKVRRCRPVRQWTGPTRLYISSARLSSGQGKVYLVVKVKATYAKKAKLKAKVLGKRGRKLGAWTKKVRTNQKSSSGSPRRRDSQGVPRPARRGSASASGARSGGPSLCSGSVQAGCSSGSDSPSAPISEPRECSSSLRYALPRCHSTVFGRDEEPLGDVAVAHAAGGELGHLALARGQRLGAAEALAARARPGRHQLFARTRLEHRGLTALRQVHAGPQPLARLAALAATPQLGAEVDQRPRPVERTGRALQAARPPRAGRSRRSPAGPTRAAARRATPSGRGAPKVRASETSSSGERHRPAVVAHAGGGDRRRASATGAPPGCGPRATPACGRSRRAPRAPPRRCRGGGGAGRGQPDGTRGGAVLPRGLLSGVLEQSVPPRPACPAPCRSRPGSSRGRVSPARARRPRRRLPRPHRPPRAISGRAEARSRRGSGTWWPPPRRYRGAGPPRGPREPDLGRGQRVGPQQRAAGREALGPGHGVEVRQRGARGRAPPGRPRARSRRPARARSNATEARSAGGRSRPNPGSRSDGCQALDRPHAQPGVEASCEQQPRPQAGRLASSPLASARSSARSKACAAVALLTEQPQRSAQPLQGAGPLVARQRVLRGQRQPRRARRIARRGLGLAQLREELGSLRPARRPRRGRGAGRRCRAPWPTGQGRAARLAQDASIAQGSPSRCAWSRCSAVRCAERPPRREHARGAHVGARSGPGREPAVDRCPHDAVAEAQPRSRASSISARRSVSAASRPVKWSSSATSTHAVRVASGPSTAAASASARAPSGSRWRRRPVARPTDSDPRPTRRSASARRRVPPPGAGEQRLDQEGHAAGFGAQRRGTAGRIPETLGLGHRAIPSGVSGAAAPREPAAPPRGDWPGRRWGPARRWCACRRSPQAAPPGAAPGRGGSSSDGRSTHWRSSTAISATRCSASRRTRRHMPLSVASGDVPPPFRSRARPRSPREQRRGCARPPP